MIPGERPLILRGRGITLKLSIFWKKEKGKIIHSEPISQTGEILDLMHICNPPTSIDRPETLFVVALRDVRSALMRSPAACDRRSRLDEGVLKGNATPMRRLRSSIGPSAMQRKIDLTKNDVRSGRLFSLAR
jgi:hypothetical protein